MLSFLSPWPVILLEIPVSFNWTNANSRNQNYRNSKNMLFNTTFSTYLYPKIHYTQKLKAVNSSASDKSTTLKDVPFHSQIQKKVKDLLNCNNKLCFCCSRRSFMAAVGAASLLPIHPSHASDYTDPMVKYNASFLLFYCWRQQIK